MEKGSGNHSNHNSSASLPPVKRNRLHLTSGMPTTYAEMKREKTEKLPPLTRRSSIKRNPLSGAQLSRTDSECCGQLEGIAATGLSAHAEEVKDGSFDGPSLFLMSRPDLEAAFVAQHQDHVRRKAAFDQLSDNFTQERAKVLALEKKIEVSRSSIFYGYGTNFKRH